MDEDLYDEFGNYIGPELEIEDVKETTNGKDEGEVISLEDNDIKIQETEIPLVTKEPSHTKAIVLHEDKKYYQSSEEIYGPDVETMVQDEDTQPLEKPIIQPTVKKTWTVREEQLP